MGNNSFNFAISKIVINDLFGKYSYNLPEEERDLNKIFILYGDNGSGKTKILQILYHLLSPLTYVGHKSFISNIPFNSFEIHFTDGTIINAKRPKGKLKGGFNLSVSKEKRILSKISLKYDQDGVVPYEEEFSKTILPILKKLNFICYFISDDRNFQSDLFEPPRRLYTRKRLIDDLEFRRASEEEDVRINEGPLDIDYLRNMNIRKAIMRVEKWINRQVKNALRAGEINVYKIYTDIIKSFSEPHQNKHMEKKDISKLMDTLNLLAERSNLYSNFKMITPFNIEELVKSIRNASSDMHSTIWKVLEPYIEGLEARLEALSEIYTLLNTFIQNLNDFFVDKKVKFDFTEGTLKIKSGEEYLDPTHLSSGEKQLLQLFCNVFPARDQPSIFLIDEPEISLNIKWQRNLIQALIDITEGSEVQFILATHSIDLISQFKENAVNLVSR